MIVQANLLDNDIPPAPPSGPPDAARRLSRRCCLRGPPHSGGLTLLYRSPFPSHFIEVIEVIESLSAGGDSFHEFCS